MTTPPALTKRPQFTPEYWQKAPRKTALAHIERVTNLLQAPDDDEQWVEIVLKEGVRFRRKRTEIKQLLTANLEVHLETINEELVTGLMVPGVGWAFRMTADDLAAYAQEAFVDAHNRQQATMAKALAEVTGVITECLGVLGVELPNHPEIPDVPGAQFLAANVLHFLSAGPQ